MIIDNALDHRTVAEIQRKVARLSKLNPVCRFLRARTDKHTIARWKAELNKILLVFNVSSVGVAGMPLIVPFSDPVSREHQCNSDEGLGGDYKLCPFGKLCPLRHQ